MNVEFPSQLTPNELQQLNDLQVKFGGTLQPQAVDQADALIQERKKAHGDWRKQSALAQKLKSIICEGDSHLEPHQMEALEMIAVKMSRILEGDPNHADHWDDIAGYARLGKQGHER